MTADSVPETLAGLPAWAQAVFTVFFFLTAAVAGIFGYKGKVARRFEDQKASDTVVISAAFADGKVIKELTEAVERMTAAENRTCEAIERNTSAVVRMHEAFGALAEQIMRLRPGRTK